MFSLLHALRLRSFVWWSVPDHLSESAIAGFLDGDCTPSERSRIEAHLENCAQCRVAVVEVNRIASTYDSGRNAPLSFTTSGQRHSRRNWKWVVAGTAIAASLTFVVERNNRSVPTITSAVRASDPYASVSRTTLEATSPRDGSEVSGDTILFGWRASPGATHRLTIQDETGEQVFARDTPDTLIAISITPILRRGRLYFWRVDAISDGVIASSAVRTFRVFP
jgi:hypothetical protein